MVEMAAEMQSPILSWWDYRELQIRFIFGARVNYMRTLVNGQRGALQFVACHCKEQLLTRPP